MTDQSFLDERYFLALERAPTSVLVNASERFPGDAVEHTRGRDLAEKVGEFVVLEWPSPTVLRQPVLVLASGSRRG